MNGLEYNKERLEKKLKRFKAEKRDEATISRVENDLAQVTKALAAETSTRSHEKPKREKLAPDPGPSAGD